MGELSGLFYLVSGTHRDAGYFLFACRVERSAPAVFLIAVEPYNLEDAHRGRNERADSGFATFGYYLCALVSVGTCFAKHLHFELVELGIII